MIEKSILVSICCITYNHEKYIEEAIDSFIMQETSFSFEIVIGDDCSKDSTLKLAKKYEKAYPDIIKVSASNINLGMNANFNRVLSECKGKYIALCEGDDYWIDPLKLQTQIDKMQEHNNVGISFHSAQEINGKVNQKIANYGKEKVFSLEEVLLGDGGFMPTASIVFLRECIKDFPRWFYTKAPVGDYFIQIFCAKNSGALYINRCMSAYRIEHVNSWTQSNKGFYKQLKLKFKIIKCLKWLIKNWGKQYRKNISLAIKKQRVDILKLIIVRLLNK